MGFVLGATVAVGPAIVAGLSRFGEDAVDPLMQMYLNTYSGIRSVDPSAGRARRADRPQRIG